MQEDQKGLSLTSQSGLVDHFEGKMAAITLEDGQEIKWPREKLAADIKEGSKVRIFVGSSLTEDEERAKIAKSLLNEILKSS